MNNNSPATRDQMQTIINLIQEQNQQFDRIHRRLDRIEDRLDRIESRMDSIEEDVNTIASVFGFKRDSSGDLTRSTK